MSRSAGARRNDGWSSSADTTVGSPPGVGPRLDQRREPHRWVEGVVFAGCPDEAVGVFLQHQTLAHPLLADARHRGHVSLVARVALLDRGARVAGLLTLRPGAGEGHEAPGVPPLLA